MLIVVNYWLFGFFFKKIYFELWPEAAEIQVPSADAEVEKLKQQLQKLAKENDLLQSQRETNAVCLHFIILIFPG